MKADRLIGILSILLQEEKTTAPEQTEKFEVSRRTINRDIEELCKAGIPIKTAQGSGGGISIMDGLSIDRTMAKVARRKSKNHLKGPAKWTEEDDRRFEEGFQKLIESCKSTRFCTHGILPEPSAPT